MRFHCFKLEGMWQKKNKNVEVPLNSITDMRTVLQDSFQHMRKACQAQRRFGQIGNTMVIGHCLLILYKTLLSFARDFASATFSLSKAPHLRSVIPHSISYESLRKFVHSLLHTISRCYNNNKSPFQVPEFPIFYAISTTLHHDRTSHVHAIACRIRWKNSHTPFSI